MAENTEMIDIREQYIARLRAELLGPGSEISIPDAEHEIISSSPEGRYSIGILFPQNNKLQLEQNDTQSQTGNNEEGETDADDIALNNDQSIEEKKLKAVENSKAEDNSESEDDSIDEEVSLATQNMPSSMGITFVVDRKIDKVVCNVDFATYRRTQMADCRAHIEIGDSDTYTVPNELTQYVEFDKDEKTIKLKTDKFTRKTVYDMWEKINIDSDENRLKDALYKLADQSSYGYVRVPHSVCVSVDFGNNDYIDNNKKLDKTSLKLTALRRVMDGGKCSITLMLVNDSSDTAKSEYSIFQPMIQVKSEGNGFKFVSYTGIVDFDTLDDDEKSLQLQYRNKKNYATGLGTSTGWQIDDEGKGNIHTDYFPTAEIPSMNFNLPENSNVSPQTMSMKYLSDFSDAPREEKINKMSALVQAYSDWIDVKEKEVGNLSTMYREIAFKNITGCRSSCKRMKEGLKTLTTDDLTWNSFCLANRAMFMQRVHLKLQEKTSNVNRYGDDPEVASLLDKIQDDYRNADKYVEDPYSWRPFQLAFLLMSVNSIVKDDSKERNIVDLIWFATGGGKTEAYLGLTAFTIFYRRLAHEDQSTGTAVIMRYTLRLLATQQFTRASTLICACEYIRQDAISRKPKYGKYCLGREPITIGLWIGGSHTPNKDSEAKENLKMLNSARVGNLEDLKDKHNKFQVLKCPWCGTKLVQDRDGNSIVGDFGYRMVNNRHFEFFCPQEACGFNNKLPVQIVDEELYNNPPTLLFGTVDKFAMMPWKGETGAFFAAEKPWRAPELIIQDELHLISGPLGTMVGLYESAIDYVIKKKGVAPKIIASTATIRRAAEQCAALYDRDVVQFPHPALDAEDSFFARESKIDYEKGLYGRKYIGLMPSGKTKAMMEIRSIATLMQNVKSMEMPDNIKDKYWTLTVYFNSLKELGKCSTLVEDDVKDAIKRMSYRSGKERRIISQSDELTSRVSTVQLNKTLDKLEKLSYSKENIENKRWPSNILLATNMISVGIDVARLNVMLLVGQPKLTSEYIQASSRIGRSYPGVAITLYDGAKSRDRSHYEQFRMYHESFYRNVEPTCATPFSAPARKRALHAVLIAIMRMVEDDLSEESDAAVFTVDKYKCDIDSIKQFILDRNADITKRINNTMKIDNDEIACEIDNIFEKWQNMAENHHEDKFFYGSKYMGKTMPTDDEGRLMKPYNTAPRDEAFDTMTSMRNVDSTVNANVLIFGEDGNET